MSDNTHIEWTDATANVVNGCSLASPGCTNCYAMRLAGTRLKHHPSRAGLTQDSKAGPVWTGEVRFNEKALLDVLRWTRPRRIFWNAHGDLFHPNVPDEWIDRCFAVMALTPEHTHQVLTKRSARMRDYMTAFVQGKQGVISAGRGIGKPGRLANILSMAGKAYPACTPCGPLPNVWLGVSVEDQTRANERIPDLLATPAAVRWISAEPLLGELRLDRFCAESHYEDWLRGEAWDDVNGLLNREIWGAVLGPKLDWVVVGGESGPGARPMHPDWARSLRDQCAAAGVPFLFKQWGEWGHGDQVGHDNPALMRAQSDIVHRDRLDLMRELDHGILVARIGKKAAGRLLDGVQHDGYPA